METLEREEKATPKKISVVDGQVLDTLERFKFLSILWDGLNVGLDFIVVEQPPYDIIIGMPTLKALQAVLHYRIPTLMFKLNNETLKCVLEHDVGQKSQTMKGTNSEDFTSDVNSECASEEYDFFAFCQNILLNGESGYDLGQLPLRY